MSRLKSFSISHAFLKNLFETGSVIGPAKVTSGLPKDAQIFRIFPNQTLDATIFVVSSEEFDEVEEGAIIPLLPMEFEKIL